MHHPTDRITHTTAFVTPVVEHWLEREIAQWVHPMKDRSDDPPHHERTLYLWATSRSSIPLERNSHFCGCLFSWRELTGGKVLFNDALNTIWMRLYGVGHMVKDHSYSERGNPLSPIYVIVFSISSKDILYCYPTGRIANTPALFTPEIAQWVHHEGSIRRPIAPWVDGLTTELYLAP